MADHLTEEEQVQALKRWWNENWSSIVLPIFVALAVYTGWNVYQDRKESKQQAMSDRYQSMMDIFNKAEESAQDLSAEQRSDARIIAGDIVENYGSGMYVDLSNLMLAKMSVEDKQLDEAATYLKRVVDSGSNDSVILTAKTRLARIYTAQGKHDEALALLESVPAESAFEAIAAELKGDVYLAQGKQEAALKAYDQALTSLDPQQYTRRNIIQMKIDSNQIASAAVEKDMESSDVEEDASADEAANDQAELKDESSEEKEETLAKEGV